MTPEQEQAIAELRSRQVAPKQIARQLGLRPAEVSAVIKAQAEQITAARVASGELNPLFQCLINKNCLPGLLPDRYLAQEGAIASLEDVPEDEGAGMAVIILSRRAGFNRLEVATYLVDLWCLGVKDVSGPRLMNPSTYKDFADYAYQPFPTGTEEISLEIAQAIILGAVDYAAALGFQPHPEFEQVREHLGPWNGEPALTFGRNGKPYYVSGPYDDPMKILKTLRQSVGEGNFNFIMMAG